MNQLIKRLWKQITATRRKQLAYLIVLMLLASVAEMVSIGAVIPFLSVLANPETIFNHDLAQSLIAQFGIVTPEQLLLPLTVVFVFAAMVAGLMRIILIWVQVRLANAVGSDLSYQIYRRTLYQPYSVHVARNSSEVIAAASTKANSIVGGVIQPLLTVMSSAIILLMIITTLVFLNPIVSISVMSGFAVLYLFFMGIAKTRLALNGKQINRQTNQVIKLLQEGLGGIRDVLLDGTQSIYCRTFRAADISLRRANGNIQIIGQAPRFGIETLGMVLIAVVTYTLSTREEGLISVLPILGALAIGAQRILPLLQQFYASWSKIGGAAAILKEGLEYLEQPLPEYVEGPATKAISFQKTITTNMLGFSYFDGAPWVLKSIDLKIKKGERIGFIGATGSGKSTLLDVIMGLLSPTAGALEIDGTKITDNNQREWQAHIAHIPQTIFLSDATIAENIAFGIPLDKVDLRRVRKSAQQAQISETVESWDEQYQTMVGERGMRLSGGQRQRIGIARALYKQADVLILDEATSALDDVTEAAVMNAVQNEIGDVSILMVAHRLTTLRSCDKIVELEGGKVKCIGSYVEVVERRRGFI